MGLKTPRAGEKFENSVLVEDIRERLAEKDIILPDGELQKIVEQIDAFDGDQDGQVTVADPSDRRERYGKITDIIQNSCGGLNYWKQDSQHESDAGMATAIVYSSVTESDAPITAAFFGTLLFGPLVGLAFYYSEKERLHKMQQE
jgi:hypothetical protein